MKADAVRPGNNEGILTANLRESSRMRKNNVIHLAGRVLLVLLAIFASNTSASEPEPKPLFTILYTAEAHGALLPCDCPLQPLGGVARRATLIKRFRERGPVLLLDGAGAAVGWRRLGGGGRV
jgi:hypothetical protein